DPSLIAKLLAEKQVSALIDELTENLSSDMAYTPSSLSKFIGLCNYIKSSLLICEIHHNLESDIDEKVCKECENMLLKGPGSVY
ncbi:MAG: transcriptional regulator, partial [Nitrosarchaeum sp.]